MNFLVCSKSKRIIILLIILVFQFGCGADSKGGDGDGNGDGNGTTSSSVSALSIGSPQDSVEPGNFLSLTITAYDKSGNTVKGANVLLSIDEPVKAYVPSNAITESNGSATVVFQARSLSGEVIITANSGDVDATKKITILDQNAPASITLESSPTEILASKNATITATVRDSLGNEVANGTKISFSLKNTDFGSISSESTTNAGKASVTFSAANKIGTADIVATSGAVNASIKVKINPVAAASIEFDSVTQNPIAIKGSGGNEFSIIKFNVKDINGYPAKPINVRFTVSGPGGVGYLEQEDSDPYVAQVSTVSGVASVTFHSGYEAGAVTILAELDRDNDGIYDISAQTPVISIGGGAPSEKWFSVSADSWNLPGLSTDGVETKVQVRLADRFGNYNILNGHAVSFRAGKGIAIDTLGTIDSKGFAEVTLRTQSGSPYFNSSDLLEKPWETSLRTNLESDYDLVFGDKHPRLGWATFMTYTKGEEYFEDGSNSGNVNGLYDLGENFRDTVHEPFLDYNQSGSWNNGTVDPFEDYVDVDNDNVHDDKNTTWDSDKYLFENSYIATSGAPFIKFRKADANYNIPNGGSRTFYVLICDENMNRISDGSSLSFEVDGGKILGSPDVTFNTRSARGFDESSQRYVIEYAVTIADSDVDESKAEPSLLSCIVTWFDGENNSVVRSGISGTVN